MLLVWVTVSHANAGILLQYLDAHEPESNGWSLLESKEQLSDGTHVYHQELSDEQRDAMNSKGWKLLINLKVLKYPFDTSSPYDCIFVNFIGGKGGRDVSLRFGSGKSDDKPSTFVWIDGLRIAQWGTDYRLIEVSFTPITARYGRLNMSIDGISRYNFSNAPFNGKGTASVTWGVRGVRSSSPAYWKFVELNSEKTILTVPRLELQTTSDGKLLVSTDKSFTDCKYTLEYTTNLVTGVWLPYCVVSGIGAAITWAPTNIIHRQMFFRVRSETIDDRTKE